MRSLLRTLLRRAGAQRMRRTLGALVGASAFNQPVTRCEPEKAKVIVLALTWMTRSLAAAARSQGM